MSDLTLESFLKLALTKEEQSIEIYTPAQSKGREPGSKVSRSIETI